MTWLWLSLVLLQPQLVQQRIEPLPAPTSFVDLMMQPVPVTAADITDRPYSVLGEINAEVGSFTVLSRRPSREDVYRVLWQRAQRLGADAVIRAQYGQSRVTLLRPRSRRATGVAIKFHSEPRR